VDLGIREVGYLTLQHKLSGLSREYSENPNESLFYQELIVKEK